MKIHRAVLVFFCSAELATAAFSQLSVSQRNDAGHGQQLAADAQAGQSKDLLGIMQSLQNRMHPAAVASEVLLQHTEGQTAHERQLLSDMGRLESQLESWKSAEQNLESQVSQQAATVEAMRVGQAKAIHDEQAAAAVWWDCKMLMCVAMVMGLAYFIYSSGKDGSLSKDYAGCIEAEPTQPPARKGRVQTEFVEKDIQEEAEDIVVVTLPQADIEAPNECKQADITENVWNMPSLKPLPDETTPEHTPRSDTGSNSGRRESKCQFFNMAEEIQATTSAKAEDAWWNDSAGY